MVNAAVSEPNPSFNRRFVEPCVAVYGPKVVQEKLLGVIK